MGVLSFLSGLSAVPSIISGIDTVFGLFKGGGSAQAAVTANQAALFSGGAAGRVLSTGTSIGPVGALAGGSFQRGVDIAQQIAVTALPLITGSPVPAFLQQEVAAQRGAAGGLRTVTRRQLILMQARAANPGATSKKIIRSARECGIELAAATFGLNALDVCFLIAQPPTRRSRGISAADMRRTRSTIRKVHTISRQLTALKPAVARRKH
jgi:hypothetical protein